MSLDEKIVAELKRQSPWQYEELKDAVKEIDSERSGKNPYRVWLVTLKQTEPVWARTKKQALKIGKKDVEWAEYDGDMSATPFRGEGEGPEGIYGAIPWGLDCDMTVEELMEK